MKRTQKLYIVIYALLIAATVVPSFIQLQTPHEQQQSHDRIVNDAANASVQGIFGNNLMIALIGLIPAIGWVEITIIMFQTGIAISSFNNALAVLFNPFLHFETAIYALMIFYSVRIVGQAYSYAKTKDKTIINNVKETFKTALFFAVPTVFLLAVIETLVIKL